MEAALSCLVCDRAVDRNEPDTYHPRYFADLCICRDCLAGERQGYPQNADPVRQQLARLEANRRRAQES